MTTAREPAHPRDAPRVVAEMPADEVYGLDLQFAAVRRAKRLLAG